MFNVWKGFVSIDGELGKLFIPSEHHSRADHKVWKGKEQSSIILYKNSKTIKQGSLSCQKEKKDILKMYRALARMCSKNVGEKCSIW